MPGCLLFYRAIFIVAEITAVSMKSFCICTFIFLIFFMSDSSRGQNLHQEYAADTFQTLPHKFKDGFVHIFTRAGRSDPWNGWYLAGYVTITTGIIYSLDTPVYNQFNQPHAVSSGPAIHSLAAPGRIYDVIGPEIFILGTSGILLTGGYINKDSKLVNTGWTMLEAVLFTQLITNVMKFGFGRIRPYMQKGATWFDPVNIRGEHAIHSMPSGHTSRIFALATVLASSYDTPWIRIPAYALAGSVALQRLESNKHWLSDVVVGGTLGYLIGRSLAKYNNLIEHKSKIRVTPMVRGGLLGLNIGF